MVDAVKGIQASNFLFLGLNFIQNHYGIRNNVLKISGLYVEN